MIRFALLLLLPALTTACAKEGKQLLSVRVPSFEFHGRAPVRGHVVASAPGGILEAVLDLAIHANVRICVEYLFHLPGEQIIPIEVNVQNETVEKILQQMIEQDPRYQYRERSGVIEVLPVQAAKNPGDCLNMRILLLRVKEPWRYAFGSVLCQILLSSRNPFDISFSPVRAIACAKAASHVPYPPDKVLKRTFVFRTVRDILNELASEAGNVAWYAESFRSDAGCENMTIGEYQPKVHYPLEPPSRGFTEKPPAECLKCHYHKPPTSD